MQEIFEQQASQFLDSVAKEQDKLLNYAHSLTKDKDAAHDLYADTLLKCRDRIFSHGFNGEGYLAYLITSLKFNHYYAKRSAMKLDFFALQQAQEQDENREERQALAAGVRAFIVAHFSQEEVAVFELHLQGLTQPEIVFLTDCKHAVQVHRIIQKVKREVKAAFVR
ncbi:sigma-70 RNA polymerase sigma factor region 4 domain-containing protein [Rufibacter soli]